MKWLNNVSVRGKLLIITIPLAIALVFSVVFMAAQIRTTHSEVSNVYYDLLYNVNSNLLNADRDLYQSVTAAMQYYDFINGFTSAPPEFAESMLPGNYDDYSSNKQQVYDRVRAAIDLAKTNERLFNEIKSEEGTTFKEEAQTFEDDMAAWEAVYDVKGNTGDWEGFHNCFGITRNSLDHMQQITEKWAEEENTLLLKEIQQKVLNIAILYIILMVVLTVVVVFVIRGIRLGIIYIFFN